LTLATAEHGGEKVMSSEWDQATIQLYITDQVQESLTLEFKAADSLVKTDGKRTEITKDISAMANSAGGTLIYGLAEFQQADKRHLPERIDPIDQTQFSKEWLKQVINNIHPRIDDVQIYPAAISGGPNQVVNIVEVPQGTTAHQATDFRYYKRFNFQSVPMEDYEIRDVLARQQHPKIELQFEIELTTDYSYEGETQVGGATIVPPGAMKITTTKYTLKIRARNAGRVYAQYVNAFVDIPIHFLHEEELEFRQIKTDAGVDYCALYFDYTVRDVVGVSGLTPVRGPSRYDPILPRLSHTWNLRLSDKFERLESRFPIRWSTYADNAAPNTGETSIENIEKLNHRK
jgi:Putative DNA-binding domain